MIEDPGLCTKLRSRDLRVVTLNLGQRYGAWADRRVVLRDGLRNLQPDLLAFQESIKCDDYDQITDLLDSEFHLVHHKVRDPNGMGISIASRWPLGEVAELNLNVTFRTEGFPCSTLVAEIKAPAPIGPLLFANHFPSWQLSFEYERELQAVATARFLEELLGQTSRWYWLATSTLIQIQPVFASGPEDGLYPL